MASALWDGEPLVEDAPINPGAETKGFFAEKPAIVRNFLHEMERKARLSRWLSDVVAPVTERSVSAATSAEGKILALLCGHQIERACELASQSGNLRLATLLAQASVERDPNFREDVDAQIRTFTECGFDPFIAPDLLNIYNLLAGRMDRITRGLEWINAFALYLWYGDNKDCTIASALEAYTSAFRAGAALAPSPAYLDGNMQGTDRHDILYQLLRLFCDGNLLLEHALDPRNTSSGSLTDVSLIWLLYVPLKAAKIREFRTPRIEAWLHCAFADQLESAGLWEWAVFVALHLPSLKDRVALVRAIIERNAVILPLTGPKEELLERDVPVSSIEEFTIEVLHVPRSWLLSAKALRAKYEGRMLYEAICLVQAGYQTAAVAHAMLLESVAPICVVRGYFALLEGLLRRLERTLAEVMAPAVDWELGGSVCI